MGLVPALADHHDSSTVSAVTMPACSDDTADGGVTAADAGRADTTRVAAQAAASMASQAYARGTDGRMVASAVMHIDKWTNGSDGSGRGQSRAPVATAGTWVEVPLTR